MCEDCGCGIIDPEHGHSPQHRHGHSHGPGTEPDHSHEHDHDHRAIEVKQSLLSRNERLAEQNRGMFRAHKLIALNLMSSPGSGKTTLLEKTISQMDSDRKAAVIVGDLATENDAQRLQATGARAIQITTGTACHLDAHMVQHAMEKLDLAGLDLLFIENVGNLVCPASFDLGEQKRIVILSVTEGEDKPLKYPVIFHNADLVLLTKIDIAEAVEFDCERARAAIHQVAPHAQILELSAKTGAGMKEWLAWLQDVR